MKQALGALESLIIVVLVLTGIVGIAYHGFRDGGWVTRGIGAVADAYIHYPLVALGLTVALFFSYRAWRDRKSRGGAAKYFNFLLYLLMAAGMYFIGHYVITGDV